MYLVSDTFIDETHPFIQVPELIFDHCLSQIDPVGGAILTVHVVIVKIGVNLNVDLSLNEVWGLLR
jgi:hypothetical protein